MRGEYGSAAKRLTPLGELPPRARRIPALFFSLGTAAGTTSACAENTTLDGWRGVVPWNYLRVRGEYIRQIITPPTNPELPPRARRILSGFFVALVDIGTTSACAENTGYVVNAKTVPGNYLRVRGEYISKLPSIRPELELPPRARRILFRRNDGAMSGGTTSACAENTFVFWRVT